MRQAKLYRYQIPLVNSDILREQKITFRSGYWLQIQDVNLENQVCYGYGEMAPLTGFSHETDSSAKEQLLVYLREWINYRDINIDLDDGSALPAVACCFSFALDDLETNFNASLNDNSANSLTNNSTTNLEAIKPTKATQQSYDITNKDSNCDNINSATKVHLGSTQNMQTFLDRLLKSQEKNKSANLKIAKLKIGYLAPDVEAKLINQLFENLAVDSTNNLSLRLDANRKWNLEQALSFVKNIKQDYLHLIDFIEEPCNNPADSLLLAKTANIAIAFDETVQENNYKFKPVTGLSTIVIKPMLIGSYSRCLSLINQAKNHEVTAIISSSIESPLGIALLARFAKRFTANTPAGLDTLTLFAEPIFNKPFSLPFDIDLFLNNQINIKSNSTIELIAEL